MMYVLIFFLVFLILLLVHTGKLNDRIYEQNERISALQERMSTLRDQMMQKWEDELYRLTEKKD